MNWNANAFMSPFSEVHIMEILVFCLMLVVFASCCILLQQISRCMTLFATLGWCMLQPLVFARGWGGVVVVIVQ